MSNESYTTTKEINFDFTTLLQSYFLYKENKLTLSEVDNFTHHIINNKYNIESLLIQFTRRQIEFFIVVAKRYDAEFEELLINQCEAYLNNNPKFLNETYHYHELLLSYYTYYKNANDLTKEHLINNVWEFNKIFSDIKQLYYFIADFHYFVMKQCFSEDIDVSYIMGKIAVSVYDN